MRAGKRSRAAFVLAAVRISDVLFKHLFGKLLQPAVDSTQPKHVKTFLWLAGKQSTAVCAVLAVCRTIM